MSLDLIRQNARTLAEVIANYEKFAKQQVYLSEKHEDSDRISKLNEEILKARLLFLRIIANIDGLVNQEEAILKKHERNK